MRFQSSRSRGALALAATATTVLFSVAVSTWLNAGVVTKALIALVVIVTGFDAAARFTFEPKRVSRVLDQTLATVALMFAFAAATGIQLPASAWRALLALVLGLRIVRRSTALFDARASERKDP